MHHAFNKLNRKVSLENIKRLCLPTYTSLHNSYNTPATLYLENTGGCDTRGCMLSVSPHDFNTSTKHWSYKWWYKTGMVCRWYSSSAVGPLEGVWKMVGLPKGQLRAQTIAWVLPKTCKNHPLIKNASLWKYAQKLFKHISITDQGECHLGAVIHWDRII